MIEERAVEKIIQAKFPDAKRTRAGRRDDEGDILSPQGDFTCQVKAVKTPQSLVRTMSGTCSSDSAPASQSYE